MTKVDFHILPTVQESDLLQYVVRLTQKALSRSHQVLIATQSDEQSHLVSQALWAWQPDSFLAHTRIEEAHFKLQISHSDQCGDHHDVLINLRHQIPNYFSRFGRVFEVVSQQPDLLKASRDRYRFYKDRGYPLTRHDLRDRV